MESYMEKYAPYIGRADFGRMAREAARERDILKERLRERKERGPAGRQKYLAWKRENSILYSMYLEQRSNVKVFEARAARRL